MADGKRNFWSMGLPYRVREPKPLDLDVAEKFLVLGMRGDQSDPRLVALLASWLPETAAALFDELLQIVAEGNKIDPYRATKKEEV